MTQPLVTVKRLRKSSKEAQEALAAFDLTTMELKEVAEFKKRFAGSQKAIPSNSVRGEPNGKG